METPVMSRHSDRIGGLKRIFIVVWKDLNLLASVYLAHFIVRRTLRAQSKERAASTITGNARGTAIGEGKC